MKFLKYSVATNTFTHLLLILSQCSKYIEINGNISLSKVTFSEGVKVGSFVTLKTGFAFNDF
jgi:hypothetical protein